MSGTYGNVPYRKKNRSARIDHQTKTSIKNRALQATGFERDIDDELIIPWLFGNYRG